MTLHKQIELELEKSFNDYVMGRMGNWDEWARKVSRRILRLVAAETANKKGEGK